MSLFAVLANSSAIFYWAEIDSA